MMSKGYVASGIYGEGGVIAENRRYNAEVKKLYSGVVQEDNGSDVKGVGLSEGDIKAIADAVYDRILPMIDEAKLTHERGMLVGMPRIGRYMATKGRHGKTMVVGPQTLRRWWMELGLPLSKTPQGNWCIMKSQVDKWVYDRGVLMRKLKELGYKVSNYHGKKGYIYDAPPEWYKQAEVDHATKEVIKDRLRGVMG
jgi:hypothetical protein